MKEELTNQLRTEFPTFFGSDFYFECGDGWYDLIKNLARYVCNRTPHCKAAQVKEKFGLLRVYVDYDYDIDYHTVVDEYTQADIEKIIAITETESGRICQMCGTTLTDSNKANKTRKYFEAKVCKDCKQY